MRLDTRPRRNLTSREWAAILGASYGAAMHAEILRSGSVSLVVDAIQNLAQPGLQRAPGVPAVFQLVSTVVGLAAAAESATDHSSLCEALEWWADQGRLVALEARVRAAIEGVTGNVS